MSTSTPDRPDDADDSASSADAAGGPTLEDLAGGDALPEGTPTDPDGVDDADG